MASFGYFYVFNFNLVFNHFFVIIIFSLANTHLLTYLPKSINSKVLYRYTCDTCNSVYIGKTKRHLLVRQYEHLGTSIFTDKALKYTEKDATVIRKHCYQNQHNSRLDNFQVLGNAVNNFHLQLKESLLILEMKPSLNIAKESMPLYLFDNNC